MQQPVVVSFVLLQVAMIAAYDSHNCRCINRACDSLLVLNIVVVIAEEKRKQEFFKARGLLNEQKEGTKQHHSVAR